MVEKLELFRSKDDWTNMVQIEKKINEIIDWVNNKEGCSPNNHMCKDAESPQTKCCSHGFPYGMCEGCNKRKGRGNLTYFCQNPYCDAWFDDIKEYFNHVEDCNVVNESQQTQTLSTEQSSRNAQHGDTEYQKGNVLKSKSVEKQGKDKQKSVTSAESNLSQPALCKNCGKEQYKHFESDNKLWCYITRDDKPSVNYRFKPKKFEVKE